VLLEREEPGGQPLIIKYLNRLSDYLFVLARYAAQQLGAEEVAWMPRKTGN
jgi:cob(I)alamin adenosyltransferase